MKKYLVLLFCLSSVSMCFAQSASHFPYQSLLALNPSFAGSNGGFRDQTLVNLPPSQTDTYFNINNIFDVYLPGIKSGVGLTVNHTNVYNTSRNTSGGFTYAKYFKIGENFKIVPSLQASYTIKELYLGFNTNSIYTPYNSAWVRTEYFSLHAGMLVNYKNFYAGMSVFNINTPDAGFYTSKAQLYPVYNWHASYNLNLSENLRFNFYGQFSSLRSYTASRLSVSALCFKHLIYGFTYSTNGPAFNAGVRTNYFTAQVNYLDYFKSRSDSEFNYVWQLLFSFNLRTKDKQNVITNFEAW